MNFRNIHTYLPIVESEPNTDGEAGLASKNLTPSTNTNQMPQTVVVAPAKPSGVDALKPLTASMPESSECHHGVMLPLFVGGGGYRLVGIGIHNNIAARMMVRRIESVHRLRRHTTGLLHVERYSGSDE